MDDRRRSEIVVRYRGRERRIVLGRFASLLATLLLAAVAVVVLVLVLVLGYIALGVALLAVLVLLIIAAVRNAWWRIRS